MMVEMNGALSPRATSPMNQKKLELLRHCINDENYLRDAIQRIALVLSNELMDVAKEGKQDERKKRKQS